MDNKPQPIFERDLACPSCGFYHLHHVQVDVFSRREGAESGLKVSVLGDARDEGSVEVGTSMTGNPSCCRGAVKVCFRCESCEAVSVLVLAQHKGTTQFSFLPITN